MAVWDYIVFYVEAPRQKRSSQEPLTDEDNAPAGTPPPSSTALSKGKANEMHWTAELGRGHAWANFGWNVSQRYDQTRDLVLCSPGRYHWAIEGQYRLECFDGFSIAIKLCMSIVVLGLWLEIVRWLDRKRVWIFQNRFRDANHYYIILFHLYWYYFKT